MIRIALILSMAFTITIQANAQSRTWQASIYKSKSDSFHVVSRAGDSILIDRTKGRRFVSDTGLHLKWGQGKKKDSLKIKERDKRYLLDMKGDTLIMIYHGYKLYFTDGSHIKRSTSNDGWEFKDQYDEVIATIGLLWNDNRWVFGIENKLEDERADMLDHFIFANMTNWANSRDDANVSGGDDGDDDLWFILWLSSISRD